jgi:hypothetical protein
MTTRLGMVIVTVIAVLLVVISLATYYYEPIPTQQYSAHTWAGYVVEAPQGSVDNVTGSWIIPSVRCNAGSESHVLFWVGIDGWNTPNETVEQIGTRSDCSNGSPNYYAWYEFWPLQPNTMRIYNITLRPGDSIRASVSGNPTTKSFAMIITDLATGNSSHVKGEYQSARLATAEWIVEAPNFLNGTRFIMADFSSVRFYSTILMAQGQTRSLNSLSGKGPVNATELTYACSDGTLKAQPSTIIRADDAFSVTWVRGGDC